MQREKTAQHAAWTRTARAHSACPLWRDTLAAYWLHTITWFAVLFGLRTQPGRHAAVAWPTEDPDFGATPEFGDTLRVMNQDPVVGPEARA